jgi:hypothetical protein
MKALIGMLVTAPLTIQSPASQQVLTAPAPLTIQSPAPQQAPIAPASAQSVQDASAPATDPFLQIITARQIQEAGLVRVGELPLLFEGWDEVTLDGFDGHLVAASLSPHPGDGWLVFIDGQEVSTRLFDSQALNRLPVALHDIARVEITRRPGLFGGRYVDSGLIHIQTWQPREGRSVRGSLWTGNESGDPGPYRYLGSTAIDVEQLGPDLDATVDIAGRRDWLRLSASISNHKPRDAANDRRLQTIMTVLPEIRRVSGLVRSHQERGLLTYDFTAGLSEVADLFYFRPLGLEVPTNARFSWLSVSEELPVTDRFQVRMRTAYERSEMGHHANLRDVDFDWHIDRLSGSVELAHAGRSTELIAGLGYDRETARTGYRLRQRFNQQARIYGLMRRSVADRILTELSLQAEREGNQTALRGALVTRGRVFAGHYLSAIFSWSEQFFSADHALWYWIRQGYGILDDLGVGYSFSGEPDRSQRVTADLGWSASLPGGELAARLMVRGFTDLTMEDQLLAFNQADQLFSGPVQLQPGVAGEIASADLSWTTRPARAWRQRIHLTHRAGVYGDRLFKDAWMRLPEWTATGSWTWSPVPAFSLNARLTYRSPTSWPDYETADIESGGRYSQHVPSFWSLDVAARKWLWDQRLRASLVARNLFDRRVGYHPIGATFDLSLLVRLEILIGAGTTAPASPSK